MPQKLCVAITIALAEASLPEPGLGYFESNVRKVAAKYKALQKPKQLDLRVAKAIGSRGYNKARVSVISHELLKAESSDAAPSYDRAFQHKWRASFDLGVEKQSCPDAVYNVSEVRWDADCNVACGEDDACFHYTWYHSNSTCALAGADCKLRDDDAAEATYEKYGRNFLSSAIVDLEPGVNQLTVAGQQVEVHLPGPADGIRGIIISDPCFSGRWVSCAYGEKWDMLNRTVLLLNALAEKGDVDFFGLLGDNWYDQDGRLTTAVWRSLSDDFKRRWLITTPGNHDVWVAGGPGSTSDEYDQFGYGFMQFFAQDTIAAKGDDLFNWSAYPTKLDPDKLNNSPDNFLQYYQLGNLGIITYMGGGVSLEDLTPGLTEACAFMGQAVASGTGPAFLLLLGHWNDASSGCPAGSDAPHVRDHAAALPGCAEFGDRFHFVDGHTHCNRVQDDRGFLIGGFGMSGCGQMGFMYVDSRGDDARTLEARYFELANETSDRFDAVYDCVRSWGVGACAQQQPELSVQWLLQNSTESRQVV